jgi:hypothetical protein
MVSVEVDNLIVFYYLSASEIRPLVVVVLHVGDYFQCLIDTRIHYT